MPVVCLHDAAGAGGPARPLQSMARVTLLVAILTLAAVPVTESHGATPPLELTNAVERIPLPTVHGPLSLRVDAYESTLVLEAPDDASMLARKLAKVTRTICPTAVERDGEVLLRCRSRRLTAQLVSHAGGRAVDVRELTVLPWEGPDQEPPLVPIDTVALGLGGPCPGDTPVSRAECALREGNRREAEKLFREALGGPGAPFAAIRLGDLALASGDPAGTSRSWSQVPKEAPWARPTLMRQCGLDVKCLDSPRAAFAFALEGIARGFRSDAMLRAAHHEAFEGRALEAATALATASGPDGACAAAVPFCRRLLLAALREPGERGARALGLYLEDPVRDQGPLAVELARAAADRAQEAGAPVFGANLMAVVVGKVATPALPWHLLRTAELYQAGGDRARAEVVAEFARSRLGKKVLRHPRWRATSRGAPPTIEVTKVRERLAGLEADLAAAKAALSHARMGAAP